MKTKIIAGAIVALAMSSCKKDWTCECTTQVVGAPDKDVRTYTIKETSRQVAYNHCAHTQTTFDFMGQPMTIDEYCELK
jgi:hypothetical protein